MAALHATHPPLTSCRKLFARPPVPSISTHTFAHRHLAQVHRFANRDRVVPGSRCIQCSAGAATAMPQGQQTTRQTRLTYHHFECNAWEAKFAQSGVTMLVDPWLVGELTFAEQAWVFRGKKGANILQMDVAEIAARADFVLLSQGLPDHAHIPTLKALPKDLPIVGSPTACRLASQLGFKQVYELQHGKDISMCDGKLNIKAFQGALVGPPWSTRENSFVIKEAGEGGVTLFYEPHCDVPDSTIKALPPVDVIVTATSSQSLLGYELVQGASKLEQVVKGTRPKVLVPLSNAEFKMEGPLAKLITEKGTPSEVRNRLQKAGCGDVEVQLSPAGTPLEVAW